MKAILNGSPFMLIKSPDRHDPALGCGIWDGNQTCPETRYLLPQSCQFPGCSYRTEAGIFKAVNKRQEDIWLHLTTTHGVDRPVETGWT